MNADWHLRAVFFQEGQRTTDLRHLHRHHSSGGDSLTTTLFLEIYSRVQYSPVKVLEFRKSRRTTSASRMRRSSSGFIGRRTLACCARRTTTSRRVSQGGGRRVGRPVAFASTCPLCTRASYSKGCLRRHVFHDDLHGSVCIPPDCS